MVLAVIISTLKLKFNIIDIHKRVANQRKKNTLFSTLKIVVNGLAQNVSKFLLKMNEKNAKINIKLYAMCYFRCCITFAKFLKLSELFIIITARNIPLHPPFTFKKQ